MKEVRMKNEIADHDELNEGHNCGHCQPLIKGESLEAWCFMDCRPDSKKRGGDAFHLEGCYNS